jgi:hypothetical protein
LLKFRHAELNTQYRINDGIDLDITAKKIPVATQRRDEEAG